MRNIKIIEVKSEIGAGTRGASLGVDAIKIAALDFMSSLFVNIPTEEVENENKLLYEHVASPHAKRIKGIHTMYERVSQSVQEALKSGLFPIVLAGDHSTAGGTIAGIKMAHPKKKLGVVWIDAHGDLHTPYTTPSGNMHGMPLATALNEDNLESKQNDPHADTVKFWNEMKNTGGIAPKIDAKDLGFIGLRDLETPEVELMERKGIKNISVDELREVGVQKIIERLEEKYADCDEIYVSFDVDSMDPDIVSHGTGTPVPHGLTPKEASELLRYYAGHPKVKCIEFVEVNPCLDEKTNHMAEVAYYLMKEVVEVAEKKA